MKLSSGIHFARLVAMLALTTVLHTSEAFTASSAVTKNIRVFGAEQPPSASRSPSTRTDNFVGVSMSPTELRARKKDLTNAERGNDKVNSIIGIDRGLYLWAIVLAVNVWFFSIPVEFRRTRICNEADTAQFPDRCMTANQFKSGIRDYYANGGGIKWDFSIEGRD